MSANEIQRRRKRNKISFLIFSGIVALIFLVMTFFNGKWFFLTRGMGEDELLKIEGEALSPADARVLLADARTQYESVFSSSVWEQEMSQEKFDTLAKEQVRIKMFRLTAMNCMANDRGVALSREERKGIAQAAEEYLAGLTQEQAERMGVSRSQMETLFTKFAIAKRMYNDITENLQIEVSADEARVILIQYIAVETKAAADEAMVKIANGDSFRVLAQQYNQREENSVTLKRGETEPVFEEAAFNLKSGEVSPVLQVGEKYYIIQCISDNEKSMSESNKAAIIDKRRLDAFNEIMEKYESRLFVEFDDAAWEMLSVSGAETLGISFDGIFSRYF